MPLSRSLLNQNLNPILTSTLSYRHDNMQISHTKAWAGNEPTIFLLWASELIRTQFKGHSDLTLRRGGHISLIRAAKAKKWGKCCWWLLSSRAALGVKGSEKRSEKYPKDCAKQQYKSLNYIIKIYKCTVRAVQCIVNKSDGNMELPVRLFSPLTALLFTFLHTFWQYICKCQPSDLLVWNLPSAPVWGWTCSRNLHL